jgi:hypothetical protein
MVYGHRSTNKQAIRSSSYQTEAPLWLPPHNRLTAAPFVLSQSLRESIQHDNLLLAAGSLVVSWCNCVPCMLGILLSLKLKHRPRASQADESHLRV